MLRAGGDALSLKDLAWTLNCNRPMGPVRMAVVGLSHTDLAAKLERAIKRLGDAKTRNIKEIEGIYHFKEPLGLHSKLAFLFPGEGSQYRNMLGDLCIHFPEVRRVFDLMDRAYENHARDYLPSDVDLPAAAGISQPGPPVQHGLRRGNGVLRQPGDVRADREAGHPRRCHGGPFHRRAFRAAGFARGRSGR